MKKFLVYIGSAIGPQGPIDLVKEIMADEFIIRDNKLYFEQARVPADSAGRHRVVVAVFHQWQAILTEEAIPPDIRVSAPNLLKPVRQ
jgi:hypothetical protein